MKILVTGGLGFIGSNLIRYLLNQHKDIKIVNVDKMGYGSNPANLKDLENDARYDFVKGDISNYKLMEKIIPNVDAVINVAAETHVDRSISNPEAFLQSNTLGTFNILEAIRKLNRDAKLIQVSTDEVYGDILEGSFRENDRLSPSNPYSASKASADMFCLAYHRTYDLDVKITRCYDAQTRLLTEDGLKTVYEVREGDLVWSLDNGILKLVPVQKVYKYYYRGEMIRFKNDNVDLLVTPNHRIICKSRKKPGPYYVKLAKDFLNIGQYNRYYIPLTGKWIGEDREYIKTEELVDQENIRGHVNKLPKVIKTDHLLAILGWYISEGSLLRGTNCKDENVVSFTNYNDQYLKEIEQHLQALGLKPWYSHPWELRVNCKSLVKILKTAGKGARNKKIPKWALKFSPRHLRFLWDSLVKGDGTSYPNAEIYYTYTNSNLGGFIELVLKLGWSPKVSVIRTYNPDRTKLSEGHIIRVRRKYTRGSIEGRHVTKTFYSGLVWCVSTPTGNVFVERNGVIVNCGNSTNNFGPYQFPEKLIPKTIIRASLNLKIPVYGSGRNVRDWIYVIDHCEALEKVLFHGSPGEIYNISAGNEYQNIEVVKRILQMMDKPEDLIEFVADRPGHDIRYSLDSSKIRNELGWRPRYSFDEALEETVNWYLDNEKWWRPLANEKILHPTPWKLKW